MAEEIRYPFPSAPAPPTGPDVQSFDGAILPSYGPYATPEYIAAVLYGGIGAPPPTPPPGETPTVESSPDVGQPVFIPSPGGATGTGPSVATDETSTGSGGTPSLDA